MVDDASWVMGFMDIIDPALESIKRLLNLDRNSYYKMADSSQNIPGANEDSSGPGPVPSSGNLDSNDPATENGFDLDAFIVEKLSLDPSNLDIQMQPPETTVPRRVKLPRRISSLGNAGNRTAIAVTQSAV